jgi:hypothetical protein
MTGATVRRPGAKSSHDREIDRGYGESLEEASALHEVNKICGGGGTKLGSLSIANDGESTRCAIVGADRRCRDDRRPR